MGQMILVRVFSAVAGSVYSSGTAFFVFRRRDFADRTAAGSV